MQIVGVSTLKVLARSKLATPDDLLILDEAWEDNIADGDAVAEVPDGSDNVGVDEDGKQP